MTLSSLIGGYHEFRRKYFGAKNKSFAKLVKYGQKPKFLVIACSDSRVDPAILTNSEPGDLFVIRNVANLVPPCENDNSYHGTSAALEFGICALGIKEIIVLGHTQCGGITGALELKKKGVQPISFVSKWVSIAENACAQVLECDADLSFEKQIDQCGKYALINSYHNLLTFPWIKENFEAGNLVLHIWNFDLKKGVLECYDPETKSFVEI